MGERLLAPSTNSHPNSSSAAAASTGNKSSGGDRAAAELALRCPRCDSTDTKFCYYNNYSRAQPRHFCKACKRYWTRGGTLRNVPVGGGCRKTKHLKKKPFAAAAAVPSSSSVRAPGLLPPPLSLPINPAADLAASIDPLLYSCSDMGLAFPSLLALGRYQPDGLMSGDYQLQNPQQPSTINSCAPLFEPPLLSSTAASLVISSITRQQWQPKKTDGDYHAAMAANASLGIDLKEPKVEGEQWRIPSENSLDQAIADDCSFLYWGSTSWAEANNLGSSIALSSISKE